MREGDNQASVSVDGSSEDPIGVPVDDTLSALLETVRLQAAFFFLWEPRWPYAMGVPNGRTFSHLVSPTADQVISYHIVTEGPCWGCVAGEEPVLLQSGDVLLLPRGDAYVIASQPRPPQPDDAPRAIEFFTMMAAGDLPPVIVNGGTGPETNRVICGFLGCAMHPFNPLLSTLPKLLHLRTPQGADEPLSALVNYALTESRAGGEGARCVLQRLAEVMFVEVIRRYLRTDVGVSSGWLGGLRDQLVGRALHVLHERIYFPWTLERLAQEIGSSRSTLAERFNTLVGVPPMQYLTQWRMQVAASRLADGSDKNLAIARAVGYESEASFSRAFKRVVGMTPTQWRERHRVR